MAEEAKAAAGPIRMVAIDAMVEKIRYKGQILARTNKVDSAASGSGLLGFIAGIVVAMVMILVPALFL